MNLRGGIRVPRGNGGLRYSITQSKLEKWREQEKHSGAEMGTDEAGDFLSRRF